MSAFRDIIVVVFIIRSCQARCSDVYGGSPCRIQPPPPGKYPGCFENGSTYCLYDPDYPVDRIDYLIRTWRFDFSTLFLKEKEPTTFYLSNYYDNKYNHDSYYRKPPSHYNEGYNPLGRANHLGNNYINNDHLNYNRNYQSYSGYTTEQHSYFDPKNWGRFRRSYSREKRSGPEKVDEGSLKVRSRPKRQQASDDTLCASQKKQITPVAAMNADNRPMYLVRDLQTVIIEECVNPEQPCSDRFRDGYSSRCIQKYSMKRLVALDPTNNKLVNELFPLPCSCQCVTNSNNI